MKRFGWLLLAIILVWPGVALGQTATDTFVSNSTGLSSPAKNAFTVTPHDTNQLTFVTRGIWVGAAGNMIVITSGGDTVTLVGIVAGTLIPLRVHTIKATGTTAASIVGLY